MNKPIILGIIIMLISGCTHIEPVKPIAVKSLTTQKQWEVCREIAWNKCFSDDIKSINEWFNKICYIAEDCQKVQEIQKIISNCWDNYADDCDAQFDMSNIEAAQIGVLLAKKEYHSINTS